MKQQNLWRVLLTILVVFGLVVAGCGNDDDDAPSAGPAPVEETPDAPEDTAAPDDAGEPMDEDPMALPGEGVSVSMARANWSEGYMQAAIYRALLQELGFEVSDPSEAELGPAVLYPAMGEGEFDFWVNGWFPIHATLIENAGLSDVVQPIGSQISAGALQGFIVDKATADANGVTKMGDIGDNPEVAALFDIDGNGKADLMGCDDGWGCHVVINDTIAQNGWEDTIEQVSATHAALFADSLGRFNRGESILQYVWTPATFTAKLVPGEDVIWLSLDNPVQDAVVDLPADQCPGQPCRMGFDPADIRVVARNDFLMANPAAAKLFELVTIPTVDVLLYALSYEGGANSEADVREAAAQWISDNRANVDQWLNEALNASGFTPAAPEPESEPMNNTPGEGVDVSMARANWSEGYMQAAIYRALLQELGFEVSDPSEAELGPAVLYPAMGEGEFDFWVNGWFPIHATLIENAGLSDVVQPIGSQISAGALQGFIVDKATADANGVTKMGDIGDNPEVAALFDIDGNGKADLMGCDDGWGCHVVINDTIAQNGWEDTIEQVSATHAALFADSLGRFNRGESILQYVWTPATFTAKLVPGEDVIWLSLDNPVQDAVVDLPADQCPGQPCRMGFDPADIRVVARNDFLMANPAAAKLFELVTIPTVDVLLYALSYEGGANSEADVREAAAQWISDNRANVDQWLNEARGAS